MCGAPGDADQGDQRYGDGSHWRTSPRLLPSRNEEKSLGAATNDQKQWAAESSQATRSATTAQRQSQRTHGLSALNGSRPARGNSQGQGQQSDGVAVDSEHSGFRNLLRAFAAVGESKLDSTAQALSHAELDVPDRISASSNPGSGRGRAQPRAPSFGRQGPSGG